jgi:hypothetical protein
MKASMHGPLLNGSISWVENRILTQGLESRAASQYGDADNRAGFNAQIVLLNKLYAIVIRTFVGI